jgi:hypothetical protein
VKKVKRKHVSDIPGTKSPWERNLPHQQGPISAGQYLISSQVLHRQNSQEARKAEGLYNLIQ